jgi:hypothetical protein
LIARNNLSAELNGEGVVFVLSGSMTLHPYYSDSYNGNVSGVVAFKYKGTPTDLTVDMYKSDGTMTAKRFLDEFYLHLVTATDLIFVIGS